MKPKFSAEATVRPKYVPMQEVQFNVSLRFSLKELDQLSSEQLTAFFHGLGNALAMQAGQPAGDRTEPAKGERNG